jgi:hypothetical protein
MLTSVLSNFLDSAIVASDPVERFRRTIAEPDHWQSTYLLARDEFICCLCSRQTGKSSATSILAYDTIAKGEFVLILAPSERQSIELLRKIQHARNADRHAPPLIRSTMTEVELLGGGRCVVVPASSDTLRGFSAASLIIVEEAAFCPDEAINAILPSRAEDGRVIMITTPGGSKECFFYQAWSQGNVRKIMARSTEIPRMTRKVAFDRMHMPSKKFQVEHLLQWLGNATQFIDTAVINAAFSDSVAAIRL